MPGRVPGSAAYWGWHRLDDRWAGRLVRHAGIGPGDLVLDIGAGTGAITRPLVEAGARVVAIELHPVRAARLRDEFHDHRVKVLVIDAADLSLPGQPFRVVANPPFGITAALLRRLTSRRSQLIRADLVVPAWAAARWAAGRGHGAPGQRVFRAAVSARVPRTAFRPPPPRDAAVLTIEGDPSRPR